MRSSLMLLVVITVSLSVPGQAQILEKKWQESFAYEKSSLLTPIVIVDNVNGGIEVMGHDGDQIAVVVDIRWTGKLERDLEQAAEELELLVEQTSGGLLFYVQTPSRRNGARYFNRSRGYNFEYDFKILVPQDIAVDLSTVNTGDITVKNLDGNFTITQVNGNVTLSDMAGFGSVESVNGDITIDYSTAPEEDTEVKTINGNILVTFNSFPSTDVYLATAHGVLTSDFDFQLLPGKGAVTKEIQGGLTRYVREPYTRIRLRDGGPVMKLKSFVGDIRIRQNTRSKNS